MGDKPSIFISHSHSDWRLAGRLQELLKELSGHGIEIARSSEEGAIKSGENWRDWIDDQVLGCDVAIVLLTPGSFRARWVLWEAGAVAGVQYERLKESTVSSDDPLARRVRVLCFGLEKVDLGPFGSSQARKGLKPAEMEAFVKELLAEFRGRLDEDAVYEGMMALRETVREFVERAKEDLRYTPIHADEGIIQDWLSRLEDAREDEDDPWIVAAKRWINVALLGAANADAHTKGEAIDFRLHMRIAEAHMRLEDWPGAAEQLQLAAKLSPNDLVVLRKLGRVHREMKEYGKLEQAMQLMERLDPEIFRKDREGITLRCGYFAKLKEWGKVDELLAAADERLVSQDAYLANWRALASMKARGAEQSAPRFERLKRLLQETGKGFWDDANLVNALLALDEHDEARRRLKELELGSRPRDEVSSATRFYDDILSAFGHDFDWREAAGIAP